MRAAGAGALRRLALCAGTLLGCAASAAAQVAAPAPPGPYAFDVRVSTVGIPQATSFYPTIPAGTVVPARGFGVDLGGHFYAGRLGPARLGIGGNFVRVRGTAATPVTTTTSTTTTSASSTTSGTTAASTDGTVVHPAITSSIRLIAPQLSLNFGTAAGWSYLSAGLTLASVKVQASAVPPGSVATSRDSGNTTGFNIGFGARWFVNRHVAASFDVRFHRVSSSTLVAAGAGLSLK
jgi:hypothetical protein